MGCTYAKDYLLRNVNNASWFPLGLRRKVFKRETNWGLYNDRQNSTYRDEIDMSNTFY